MRILDLFAGLGGERRRKKVEARGHEYVTLDFDPAFECDLTRDILTVTPEEVSGFDFIWASPPCEAFSVASIGHHWNKDRTPRTVHAVLSQKIVAHTRYLIECAAPRRGFVIENPMGMLRTLPCVEGLPRALVTYCQYGETRMKPTDLWGFSPHWTPRPPCKKRAKCHESAPRGANTGTQGIRGAAERAIVPWALWADILDALEKPSIFD